MGKYSASWRGDVAFSFFNPRAIGLYRAKILSPFLPCLIHKVLKLELHHLFVHYSCFRYDISSVLTHEIGEFYVKSRLIHPLIAFAYNLQHNLWLNNSLEWTFPYLAVAYSNYHNKSRVASWDFQLANFLRVCRLLHFEIGFCSFLMNYADARVLFTLQILQWPGQLSSVRARMQNLHGKWRFGVSDLPFWRFWKRRLPDWAVKRHRQGLDCDHWTFRHWHDHHAKSRVTKLDLSGWLLSAQDIRTVLPVPSNMCHMQW